jgi:hypothetical protein
MIAVMIGRAPLWPFVVLGVICLVFGMLAAGKRH